jgi:hypothetical protein
MSESTIPGAFAMSAMRLLYLLRRAADGESPDMVMAEELANAEHGPLDDRIERRMLGKS